MNAQRQETLQAQSSATLRQVGSIGTHPVPAAQAYPTAMPPLRRIQTEAPSDGVMSEARSEGSGCVRSTPRTSPCTVWWMEEDRCVVPPHVTVRTVHHPPLPLPRHSPLSDCEGGPTFGPVQLREPVQVDSRPAHHAFPFTQLDSSTEAVTLNCEEVPHAMTDLHSSSSIPEDEQEPTAFAGSRGREAARIQAMIDSVVLVCIISLMLEVRPKLPYKAIRRANSALFQQPLRCFL